MANGVQARRCCVQYLEGLQVMILGMGLVFFSLATVMFVMIGLDRAFRNQPSTASEVEPEMAAPVEAVAPAPNAPPVAPPNGAEGEVALAIALAVARARADATAGVPARAAALVAPSGEAAACQWDWLWDAGLDDYGTTKGATYANVHDHN